MMKNNDLMKKNARRSKVAAFLFTAIFHLALFGSIAYFSSPEDSALRAKIDNLLGKDKSPLQEMTMQP